MWWRVATTSAALVLVASATWVVLAEAAPACTMLQARNTATTSALHRVELPAAESTALGELDYRLNALGYADSQGVVYGIAEPGRVVTLSPTGQVRDLGPVRAAHSDARRHRFAAPTAGAVAGNRWYVQENGHLDVVDIDPASRTYLSVVSTTELRPWHWRFSLDDFDVDRVDGELYGVLTYSDAAAVVRIDRDSGRVEKLVVVPGLPPSDYGSVVIGPDRALYVTANEVGGLYRVGRDGSVAKLAVFPPMSSSDAAGCLRQVPLPPPTSTAPTTTTTPTTTAPPTSRPSTRSPTPSNEPSPTAPPPTTRAPEPDDATATQEPESESSDDDTREKRRWALAALLLLIGGSAAVRGLGR
ncbi:hypothetical protein MOQ72_25415 [Saccharopolyspora sp. K220]|uniref:DUF6923 family protein n=1 Tax=Saccharopolyspora soli TaxID=2926618 RepID=UPI001F5710C5|nr:hypothetical protein [Saccharopolyspora soli]MCI2420792.1 hypothetical protein [Saccharopolyspora soli]